MRYVPKYTISRFGEKSSMAIILWDGKKRIKDNFVFIAIIVMLTLATIKYVAYGESYIYTTLWTGETLELGSDTITQTIIIDEKAKWSNHSYSVFFVVPYYETGDVINGKVEVVAIQDEEVVSQYVFPAARLETGYNDLKGIKYGKLKPGYVKIQIRGIDLDEGLQIGICDNTYNIPNCDWNGEDTGKTLVQKYHYNYQNVFYKLRMTAFLFLLAICWGTAWLCLTKEESRKIANVVRCSLVLIYITLVAIYDDSVLYSPTWAEAVTNFMHYALNSSTAENWLITDAGYLPLVQRVIALITYKILKCSPYIGLYSMQLIAYIITGSILSFFAAYPFRLYCKLKYRYLFCLIFMMQVIDHETGALINFITYGVLIIFLYYLVDSTEWGKWEILAICIFAFLCCLSKGVYVTILPFSALCLVLFFRNYNKRDIGFTFCCMAGALLQLTYYLNKGFDLINWTDKKNSSYLDLYYIRLILGIFVDVPNRLLGFFKEKVSFFTGTAGLLIILFWIVVIWLFWKQVVIPTLHRKKVDRDYQVFFMMLIYIGAQSLFLRLTICGVNKSDILSDGFWQFSYEGIENRYQILIYCAAIIWGIVGLKIIKRVKGEQVHKNIVYLLLICIMITMPRLQINGIKDDSYINSRAKYADLTAEARLFKKLEISNTLLIPIQPNGWTYTKNADLYYFGDDIFGWKGKKIDSTDVVSGEIDVRNYPNVNTECGIYQIFVKKKNLINRNNYQILLYDDSGTLLHVQYQDNSNYQLITSFTFDMPIEEVAQICILDGYGNRVYIENAVYIVTGKGKAYVME